MCPPTWMSPRDATCCRRDHHGRFAVQCDSAGFRLMLSLYSYQIFDVVKFLKIKCACNLISIIESISCAIFSQTHFPLVLDCLKLHYRKAMCSMHLLLASRYVSSQHRWLWVAAAKSTSLRISEMWSDHIKESSKVHLPHTRVGERRH